MNSVDVRLNKQARSYFGKHDLDISHADVRVTYGTCIISGKISRLPKTKVESVEDRTLYVAGIINRMPGIREVVLQCTYQEEFFK